MSPDKPPDSDLVISYLALRKALGYVAIGMPMVVKLGAYWLEGIPSNESISAYYYTSMRDVFVGTLAAVGIFLFCYRGYDRQDNVLTNVAGLAAVAIGLLPMEPAYHSVLIGRFSELTNPACYCSRGPLGYHFYAVAAFFAAVSYLSIFRFTRTDKAIVTPEKRSRNRVYVLCGLTMVASFLVIAALKFRAPRASIFWPETIAIVAFAIAWLTKGEAILADHNPAGAD
jgi:hypothetical protein